jgi:hypothetical protein
MKLLYFTIFKNQPILNYEDEYRITKIMKALDILYVINMQYIGIPRLLVNFLWLFFLTLAISYY